MHSHRAKQLGAPLPSTCNITLPSTGGAKHLLSKRELATTVGVSPRTIDNWVAQRRIPRLRFSSRLTRFDLNKVEAALSRYEVKEVGGRP